MHQLLNTVPTLQQLQDFYGEALDSMRKSDKLQLILVLLFAVYSAQDGASQCLSQIAEQEGCAFEHAERMYPALADLDRELDEPMALLLAIELIQELLHGLYSPDVPVGVVTVEGKPL
jgi:GTP1/Obg family GTP-binding protein